MTLKNSLFKILSQDTSNFQIALVAEHPIYQAHFPGEPVTPGVCIIQMGVELLSEHCQRELKLVAAKNIKFQAVISPVETPELTYTFDKVQPLEDGSIKAQVTVVSGETKYASLSITCQ